MTPTQPEPQAVPAATGQEEWKQEFCNFFISGKTNIPELLDFIENLLARQKAELDRLPQKGEVIYRGTWKDGETTGEYITIHKEDFSKQIAEAEVRGAEEFAGSIRLSYDGETPASIMMNGFAPKEFNKGVDEGAKQMYTLYKGAIKRAVEEFKKSREGK